MSEMVDRAAKAAWMRYLGIDVRDPLMNDEDWRAAQERQKDWPRYTGVYPDADKFRDCARAAIEAIREPTADMLSAAALKRYRLKRSPATAAGDDAKVFTAMIDEALR